MNDQTETVETAPATASVRKPTTAGNWWWGTGRRKTAVARVRVKAGSGRIGRGLGRRPHPHVGDLTASVDGPEQQRQSVGARGGPEILEPTDQPPTTERDRQNLLNVLEKTSTTGKVDVQVNVRGGGFTGQAGAVLLGLARALRRYDGTLEPILRANNFLTRDSRKVERKKYGQAGARRRFQFSKR